MSAVIETTNSNRPQYYQDYSPEFKAQALVTVTANNGNVLRSANELGISEATLRGWIVQSDRFREFREQKQEDLAVKIEYNAHKLADSIATHDLTNVPLIQKATALGVMVDKMQLLRGLPTSITEQVERQELTVILQQSLSSALDLPEADIDGEVL